MQSFCSTVLSILPAQGRESLIKKIRWQKGIRLRVDGIRRDTSVWFGFTTGNWSVLHGFPTDRSGPLTRCKQVGPFWNEIHDPAVGRNFTPQFLVPLVGSQSIRTPFVRRDTCFDTGSSFLCWNSAEHSICSEEFSICRGTRWISLCLSITFFLHSSSRDLKALKSFLCRFFPP